jgi:hypothetical protein
VTTKTAAVRAALSDGKQMSKATLYDPDEDCIEFSAREIVLYRKDGSLVTWPAQKVESGAAK